MPSREAIDSRLLEAIAHPTTDLPRILKESGIIPDHLSLNQQRGVMSLEELKQPIGPYASMKEAIAEVCGKDLPPDIQQLIQKRNIRVETELKPKALD